MCDICTLSNDMFLDELREIANQTEKPYGMVLAEIRVKLGMDDGE